MTNPATSPSLTDAIDLGLILLDERATVRLWNDWLSKRSGIGPDKAVDQTLVHGGGNGDSVFWRVDAGLSLWRNKLWQIPLVPDNRRKM